jgi:hypothetical protein
MLSGTAIKAVIAYVTDYVTKSPVKTYNVFQTIKEVFDKNAELLDGNKERQESTHKLLTKIVNAWTTKMQIGGPMAAAYLLGQPDHCTSHNFKTFFWWPYVKEVQNAWEDQLTHNKDVHSMQTEPSVKVIIQKKGSEYVALSNTLDYTMRPIAYETLSLYDWVSLSQKKKGSPKPNRKKKSIDEENMHTEDEWDSNKDCDEEEHMSDSDVCSDDDMDSKSEHECTQAQSNKRKRPSASSSVEDLLFLPGHPQRDSHKIPLLSEEKAMIPTILGGGTASE